MNKPKNKKKCSGCGHFVKSRYGKEYGKNFCICYMDYKTNSNCGCSDWIPKKYTKDDRRKAKKGLRNLINNI